MDSSDGDPSRGAVLREGPAASRPVRVRLSRAKGWKMPPNTVKVDRTTKWGNPFVVGKSGGAYSAKVMNLRHAWQLYFSVAPQIERLVLDAQAELRGKNLACWCPHPEPYEHDCCHAAVLIEIANGPLSDGAPSASTTDADDATGGRSPTEGMQPE